jgi:ribosomal protein S18 acetylase RimI-like enzyme
VDKTITINPAAGDDDFEWCAQLMSTSDPWIALQRSIEQCRASLHRPGRELYLATDASGPTGFVILCMTGAFVGYIQSICIDPARRGMGLGSRLIAFSEERIFRESPNVFMCVSSFNKRAQDLYQRLGYDVVGRLSDYVVKGHDEILLRKTRGPLSGYSPVHRT